MQALWTAIWNKLSNDSTLVSLINYTSSTNTLKRGNSCKKISFSTTKPEAVTFQEWTDVRTNKTSNDGMRDITVLFVCWSKRSDSKSDILADYLITLLDGVDISSDDLLNYYSDYDDFRSSPYYDDDEKAWRIDIRFRFKVVLK